MSVRTVRAALLCACVLFLQHASAELRGRCPAGEEVACPARATPCTTDDECGEQVCCNASCGRVCLDPLYTGCENVKLSTERISRALAAENSRGGRGTLRPVRAPRCRAADGEFEEVQCDNEIISSCWCVDATGFEIPGTRAPAAALVNCTRAAPCAAHTCRMLCPLGFELDSRGCPKCKCRDPCADITCPGQLSCQLEQPACLRPPCPPVPTCKRGRSLHNICPVGDPLLISETARPFLCGTDPGKPNCPPLYRCLVESGNDYGVCCPASLELQKAGTCPAPSSDLECGTPCSHDLECPSMQKCCDGGECGQHCALPHNVTICTQQKMLADLLIVNEREGKGYVPQCSANGTFESRQCSRNGLVCWCVDTDGNKLRGSMGPAAAVRCDPSPRPARSGARSLDACSRALCAMVCEYGYRTGPDGCPTCECDDPCAGFPCPDGSECVRVKDADCAEDLCTGHPVCRPKVSYENPCEVGAPATDEGGSLVGCGADSDCPAAHTCSPLRRAAASVCCPQPPPDNSTDTDLAEMNFDSCGVEAEALCGLNATDSCADGVCEGDLVCCSTTSCGAICIDPAKMRLQSDRVDYTPTRNDYGVCCPASLELQKAGTCPAPSSDLECGTPCSHDLECPSMQKCCDGGECGQHCALPHNVTICTQQKMLADLLIVNEREGKGYVPQCSANGTFESRQCSRNGLVCWCVDTDGNKLRGSMGPAAAVRCDPSPRPARSGARSLDACSRALCAMVCEYGYRTGPDGCPTCECDDPCAGFPCPDGSECVRVKDADCAEDLCTGHPVCRPKVSYENPCEVGAPATDEGGSLVGCGADSDCPAAHTCSPLRRAAASVCCPQPPPDNSTDTDLAEMNFDSCGVEAEALCGLNATDSCADGVCEGDLVCCSTTSCGAICIDPAKMRLQSDRVDYTPTMCEYLRDFDAKMEGTVDGMKLALPAPACRADGSYSPRQCAGGRCWCVDNFGTEIPDTSTNNGSAIDCDKIRSELSCLELTCRMGCDYGFELGAARCPTCRCRDPCAGVACPAGRTCAVVDVACDADYCPPVPACLPRKSGQCPFLVPTTGACEWACRADAECAPTERCCATGCGTACTPTVHHTPCQQRRALALHSSAESGNPPAWTWVPQCKEDGAYEEVQCRRSDSTCWCVDSIGNEVPGTRTNDTSPSCSAPAACPDPGCEVEEVCAHGRELDSKGCPTCRCRDPCAEAKCRPDETCELVNMDCESEQCPPLARCAPAPACPDGAAPLQAPGEGAGGGAPLLCGPSAAACPSTHACRFAPHDSRPPVCCPKPRSVCFEGKDEGACAGGPGLNASRWHFNHERNRCERFAYHGCSGNHNNFRTKEECNAVCPVLSPCERLREKNEEATKKFGKGTFIPVCDASGAWEPVQCMAHIDVCWCVSTRGEPLKGSLVRGNKPSCNFRQARKWVRRDPLNEKARADEVLEELIRQMTIFREEALLDEDEDVDVENFDEAVEKLQAEGRDDTRPDDVTTSTEGAGNKDDVTLTEIVAPKTVATTRKLDGPLEVSTEKLEFKTKCQLMQEEAENDADAPRPRCAADGSFTPRQCSRGRCWCVDAAGQRRPANGPVPDLPLPDPCELTKIESAALELELIGVEAGAAERARAALAARLAALGARAPVTVSRERGAVRLRALLAGPRAADVLYHIENMVKQEKLSHVSRSNEGALGADVIRTEYRLAAPAAPAMQQREILSESTVSATTSYHTALIVLAATSAFVISVLCVLVMLYRARLQREPHKAERFLPPAPPVYVLSADERAELAKALHAPPPPVSPPDTSHDENTRI